MHREADIRFVDDSHKDFYISHSQKLRPDAYLRSSIYTLGMCHDTRRNFTRIFDASSRCINPETIREPWQTGTSLKVTQLAFQLFTGRAPTALLDNVENYDECSRYCVSEIFCCSYAPYFVEAIKLRFPEYLCVVG